MFLTWHIRYFDTRVKQFKGRKVWLETGGLNTVTRGAVELLHGVTDGRWGREMLKYRHLFREWDCSANEQCSPVQQRVGRVSDYLEDENGKELPDNQLAISLTGNLHALSVPPWAKAHDIQLLRSKTQPVPVDQVSLPQNKLRVLGYFARDIGKLIASSFYREGPGSLLMVGKDDPVIETTVTQAEIDSFVLIFRRPYMKKDPGNFVKAIKVFREVAAEHSLVNWVRGEVEDYEAELNEKPNFLPIAGHKDWAFSNRRLIDVFLNTMYAHQPSDKSASQYRECLASVGGKQELLMFLFLTVIWQRAHHMGGAGKIVADFYDRYCAWHNVSRGVSSPITNDPPGIGKLEKPQARRSRMLADKAKELAATIWQQQGCPVGGPSQFFKQAGQQLERELKS